MVKDVRATGTILAIELHAEDAGYTSDLKERIYDHFMAKDILLRPLGNVIYLIPPYVIKRKELEWIYEEIETFLRNISA
jgi:adenosylmethionine-8-amino-7-oxononanoate aminotransferase